MAGNFLFMNTSNKIKRKIKAELKKNTDLHGIAADALSFALGQGYCEYTEHPKLWKLVKSYHCPYCGRQHELKDCQAFGIEEYHKLGLEKFNAKYK